MKPLSLSLALALSSTLHGGLVALVWVQVTADRSPSRTVLELIADEAGASPVAVQTLRPPDRPRPRPAGSPPRPPEPPAAADRPIERPVALPVVARVSERGAPTAPVPPAEAPAASASRATAGVPDNVAEPAAPGPTDTAARSGAFVPPRPAAEVAPAYPEAARRAGVQGTTVLQIRVLADGSVGEVRVERSSGHAELDAAAVEAIRRWRFEPARRGSVPVEVWILLPIQFRLG